MSYNNYCSGLWSITIYWCSRIFLHYKNWIKTTPSKDISTITLENMTDSFAHTGFATHELVSLDKGWNFTFF